MSIADKIQQTQEQTVGKVLIAAGGSGTLLDTLTELSGWADVVIKYGNAILIAGGIYLMAHKIISRRHNRRINDNV